MDDMFSIAQAEAKSKGIQLIKHSRAVKYGGINCIFQLTLPDGDIINTYSYHHIWNILDQYPVVPIESEGESKKEFDYSGFLPVQA